MKSYRQWFSELQQNQRFNLLIQTNSPGELATWVRPIVSAFKSQDPESTITIFLTPCQYASGAETRMAKDIPGVDFVLSPEISMQFLTKSWPWCPLKRGAVLYLGGDPMFSQLIGLKCQIPRYAYTEKKKPPGPFFHQVFFRGQDGDLMSSRVIAFKNSELSDRAKILRKYQLPTHNYCLFFCGSRPAHFKAFFPMILATIDAICKSTRDFHPLIGLSPFIDDMLLDTIPDARKYPVIRGDSLELMACSRLLVTLPGSNTAEAMYMGLPMLVVLPLNRPDLFQFDGLLGLIGNWPWIGPWIKCQTAAWLQKKERYYALPNILACEPLVPEIVDHIDATVLSKTIKTLFFNEAQLQAIKKALDSQSPSTDVASYICRIMLKNDKKLE